MVWHSDRVATAEDKLFAEEELKKIKYAKDLLEKHFSGGHQDSANCRCHSTERTAQSESAKGPGSGYQRYKPNDEQSSSPPPPPPSPPPAAPTTNADDGLRWKVAGICAVVFLLLMMFASKEN
jgi:hypothetical protein